ncbi:ABC transporter ATP-binding protein [Clostridium neuense]|uniref:ABC transporter ATP-binding protein n=1 Tax=Clostridium neuense TaxID=1728934 RepID=A0ABW8TK87_9CLOT
MNNEVKVDNITKRFNDKLILDNISFHVKSGDIFGLIGPNGAGKSTLINIMSGIIKPNSGDVKLGGYSILNDIVEAKNMIGLVPQELAIMDAFSAYDNLMYFGAYYGLSGKLLKDRINMALSVTGLTERKRDKVKKFSGGMKRRLNLAVAIMHKPKILIMDEPTVGVDPQSRNCIFEFIRRINKEDGTTIIYTSHYMEEVETLCNNIFILDLGNEVAYGSKSEIKAMASVHGTIRLKVSDFNDQLLLRLKELSGIKDVFFENEEIKIFMDESKFKIEELLLLFSKENKKIKSFNLEEASLEEVFLAITGKNLRD